MKHHQPHKHHSGSSLDNYHSIADPDPVYTNTTIAPFDQVTIVSQNSINANIFFPWDKSTTLKAITGNASSPDSSINAFMAAPTVGLIGTQGGTQLYFYLNLAKGNLMYRTGQGSSSQQHTIPIVAGPTTTRHGWTIAYIVNLDPTSIAGLPPDLAKKVNVAGSYSVTQLLTDFETAQLVSFESDETYTYGLDSDGQAALTTLLTIWMGQSSSKLVSSLGYSVTVSDPGSANKDAPSFPPTGVDFQIIPYRDQNGNVSSSNGLNSLAFLEMTQKHAMPDPSKWQSWAANWLHESSTEAGVMVVSKANFWDTYLLSKLTPIHRVILQQMNNLTWWLYNDGNTIPSPVPWMLSDVNPIGTTADQESFDWNHPWYFNNNNAAPSWMCNIPTITKQGTDPSTPEVYETEITNTITSGGLGSSDIIITVSATMVHAVSYIKYYPVITRTDTIKLTPTYTLTLNSVSDGTINTVTTVGPNPVAVTVAVGSGGSWWNKDPSTNLEAAGQLLTANLKNDVDLSKVPPALQDLLNGQNGFAFAGGQTFAYKSIAFNKEGDLVGKINYVLQ
ncbi:hypothetical protein MMC11_001600 [Xylographa trunciseda]|nr:hypothetical protein [Xylographa trunciseda]